VAGHLVGAHCRQLRGAYAFRIWMCCPRPVRLARGLARDGDAMRRAWIEDWMPPPEDASGAAERPDLAADLVVRT
jgi:uridine kinase